MRRSTAGPSLRKEWRDLGCEPPYALLQVWARMTEVDDEAVAAGLDVLGDTLGDPLGRSGDRMPAPLVRRLLGNGRDVDADAQDQAGVRLLLAQLGGHRT